MVRRLVSWWLACALVLAQTLGAMHGVAHARMGPLAQDGASVARGAAVQVAPWAGGLFTGHEDIAGCRLFDQSSHGDLLQAGEPCAMPPAPIAPALAVPRRAIPGAPAPPFHARGPPVLG